jgi:hypothetical protein
MPDTGFALVRRRSESRLLAFYRTVFVHLSICCKGCSDNVVAVSATWNPGVLQLDIRVQSARTD